MNSPKDKWTSGDAYERFMGRWSPQLAAEFVSWLDVPLRAQNSARAGVATRLSPSDATSTGGAQAGAGKDWLDVGCGTGALTRTILAQAAPARVVGVDPSEAFVEFARESADDARAEFKTGSAEKLPVDDASFDVVVGGLMLNFVPDPAAALAEFKRAARPGGVIGAYVWDYAEGMGMLRVFWDAAVALDAAAAEKDEGRRFPLCHPDKLAELFGAAGLQGVETTALEFTMEFRDFDDYWQPFSGVQGPAPGYLAKLPPDKQAALEAEVRRRLPVRHDGSIALSARAWAVRGVK